MCKTLNKLLFEGYLQNSLVKNLFWVDSTTDLQLAQQFCYIIFILKTTITISKLQLIANNINIFKLNLNKNMFEGGLGNNTLF